jgi:hypothetical protein
MVEARPFPWSKDYAAWSSRKKTDDRATYYHGSNKTFKNMRKPYPTRPIRDSLTGNVYLMPKQDYTELINKLSVNQNMIASKQSQEYIDSGKKLNAVQTPTDYIDYAFNTDKQKKNITTAECDSGHIRKLAYNPLYKLLMVTFWNNTKCVFFNLPANLAATLLYCMENNVMAINPKSGGERHQVGVEFWNLVRVRGTLHDTRYPFQYTEYHNSGDINTIGSGNKSGRVLGSGKYMYLEQGNPDFLLDKDKRYKDGNEHERKSMRLLKEDYEQKKSEQESLAESDRYIGDDWNDNVLDYDIDNLYEYFENDKNGVYSKHRKQVSASKTLSKILDDAEDLYNNGASAGKIASKLSELHLGFPKPEDME